MKDKTRLSPRQLDVLRLLATGATNGEIARSLGIATGTVSVYTQSVYAKLRVNSREEAIILSLGNHVPLADAQAAVLQRNINYTA